MSDCASVLEVYTIEEVLELNDLTVEDCLIYLVEAGYLSLPEIKPLDYD